MKYFGALLAVFGFVFLLGTAGASDQGLIGFEQMVAQAFIGLALFGLGILVARVAAEISRIKERKE
jgi:uncharacterized membrane protein YciS (DUF1049 family)